MNGFDKNKSYAMKKFGIAGWFIILALWAQAQTDTTTFFDNKEYKLELQKFNTVASDISPYFVGEKLYFSSVREKYFNKPGRERKNKAFYDIYEVQLDEKGYADSVRALTLGFGSEYHEGPAAWCESTGELFVTLSNMLNPDTILKFFPIEHIRLRLAIKTLKDGKWEISEELPFNNSKYHYAHPAISLTGDTLVFSSDVDSIGFGKSDLYMSVRTNGKWSDPVNLGPHINTPGNEMFPVFGPGGLLLFSSDGQASGSGQLDIYRTTFPKEGSVVNMGKEINTSADDFGLVIHPNGEVGYMASGRPGAGSDDIYRVDIITKAHLLAGRVLDDLTGLPIKGAVVQLQDCGKKVLTSVNSGEGGKFEFEITAGECLFLEASMAGYQNDSKDATGQTYVELRLKRQINYALVVMDLANRNPVPDAEVSCNNNKWLTDATGTAFPLIIKGIVCNMLISKQGYLSQSLRVDPARLTAAFNVDTVWLYKPDLQKFFTLKNIYYDFDRYTIRPDARPTLDNLVGVMHQYPFNLELSSHTDSRGPDAYNMLLSQRRAQSAVDYIVGGGINPLRLTALGFGETRPVNFCVNNVPCSELLHQANRRTEFRITSWFEGDRQVPVTMKNDTVMIGSSKIYPQERKAAGDKEQDDQGNIDTGQISFTIQLLASVIQIAPGSPEFRGLEDITEKRIRPYFKYYHGNFSDYDSAVSHRDELRSKFPGCFVVAFRDGQIINILEALGDK
jgi:outer membrane protein OmpA-like peptidoglycan-associated protein